MPSSYSTHLLLELMADGENEGLWGDITNTNLEILGRAISGSTNVTLVGTTHTLTVAQGALSAGHYSVLVLQGAPTGTNTITINPNTVPRIYLVKNDSGQGAVFTQGSGGNATVADGDIGILFSDGGGASASVTDLTPGLMRNSENLSGLADAATALQNLGVTATAAELNALDGATLDISAVTATAAEVNTLSGFTGDTDDLNYAKDLRATGVTTTEFDKLDGLTASTVELNKLDGATVTTAELNILDGVTATTAELNKLDGVTVSTAEINYLDGVTSGIQTQLDGKISGVTAGTGLSGGGTSGGVTLNGVTQSTATWEAGTSTTEGVVSPAKVKAAVDALAAGGLNFISTTALSNDATVDFTGLDAAEYDGYAIHLSNVIPSTDSVNLALRLSEDSGSSFITASDAYRWALTSSGGNSGDQSAAYIRLTGSASVGSASFERGVSGWVYIHNPNNLQKTHVTASLLFQSGASGTIGIVQSGGATHGAGSHDAVQLLFSSGNLESGTINFFGIKNS